MTKFRKENTDKLLELYYSGRLDDESTQLVQGWLLSDESSEAKEASMAMLFEKVTEKRRRPDGYTRQSLAEIQKELGFTGQTDGHVRSAASMRRRVFGLVVTTAIAAAVLLGVFLLPDLFTATPVLSSSEVVIATEPGSAKEITLPDGSIVKMQGATTIVHAGDFAENRHVKIDGEAYFIVVRDESHPFVVEGRDVAVTVLGTEFNVKAFETDTFAEVTLATGKVEVASGDTNITLNPSERATIDRNNYTIQRDEIGEQELLRIRGINLSLADVTLDEAFRLIGGYYHVTMRVASGIPEIDGIFQKLDDDATLQEALFFLQAVNPVFDYHIEGDVVTITKR